MALTSNTQAILMLTAPLILGRGRSTTRPLSSGEYSKLAQRLSDAGLQPSDLLQPNAEFVLGEISADFGSERIKALLRRGLLLSQAVENWQTRSIWVVSRADHNYPSRYKQLPGQYRPPVLYGCGDQTLLQNGGLAVIGSRKISENLIEYTERVGRLAANALCTIISGGAPGVDQASVRGALSVGGTAAVVLPGELEKAAMSRTNREALMGGQLALISPFDPRSRWSVGQAMSRNKLIYGLSNAALVVESSYDEGGTWPGAVEQLNKLRFVPVYIRTTDPPSEGLEGLRKNGAFDWPNPQTPDDFRAVVSGEVVHSEAKPIKQPAFSLEYSDAVKPLADEVEGQIVRSYPAMDPENVRASSLSDMLLASVEQLLATIDKPITASDVAEHLDVSKKQAGDWLKQLEQLGKYQRRNKRAPYERVTQVNSLL